MGIVGNSKNEADRLFLVARTNTDVARSADGVTVFLCDAKSEGVTATPMHPADTHAALGGMHPLGRIARVDEIAAAVRYLVGAEFVTGAIVPVDGGFSAGR